MSIVTIIGSGMMGSALAFPARENGHEVRLVGTHLDRDIIDACIAANRHPKFEYDFPAGIRFFQIEDVKEAIAGSTFVICGVSSFGVDWFGEEILPLIPDDIPVLSEVGYIHAGRKILECRVLPVDADNNIHNHFHLGQLSHRGCHRIFRLGSGNADHRTVFDKRVSILMKYIQLVIGTK